MTIAKFLSTLLPLLGSRRDEAIAEIDGALAADGTGCSMAPEDRAKLARARIIIAAGKRLEV